MSVGVTCGVRVGVVRAGVGDAVGMSPEGVSRLGNDRTVAVVAVGVAVVVAVLARPPRRSPYADTVGVAEIVGVVVGTLVAVTVTVGVAVGIGGSSRSASPRPSRSRSRWVSSLRLP